MDTQTLLLAAAGATGGGGGGDTDPNFNQTVLLLHGDGSNGAQNNTFLDSSSNNFTITRAGNTTQGTFSPYGGRWSNYLDGSSDYFVLTDYNVNFPSGNAWTVEAWLYPTIIDTTNHSWFSTSGPNTFMSLRNTGEARFYNGSVNFDTSGAGITTNQWVHIAITRETDGTLNIWVNGVSRLASTWTGNFGDASNTVWIGGGADYNSNWFDGYIANLRISDIARYTVGFTPSTAPFVNDGNTVLLTCQSNRFVDNSSNGYTVSPSGTPKVTSFSPFAPTAAYDPAVNGGSGYFDGSGDYLDLTSYNLNFPAGTAFTIECWAYLTSLANTNNVVLAVDSPTVYLTLRSNTDIYWFDNGANRIASGANLTTGQWFHIAVCRDASNNMNIYVNGVSKFSSVIATNIGDASNSVRIGRFNHTTGGDFPGYISNLRISDSARYSSDFTPPTAPFTDDANTEFLFLGQNAGIFDSTGKNNLESVGNVQLDTTTKVFGTASIEFDGSGDGLYIPSSPNLAFGTGDFTIEFWMNTDSVVGTPSLYDPRTTSSQAVPTIFRNASAIALYASGSLRITGGTVSVGTWHHVALARSGTSTKLFLDGTQVGSTFTDTLNYIETPVSIGIYKPTGASPFDGFIDDLRITKGVARYLTSFTPPTKAFPDQ
jgi:hypothetical protein